MTSYYEILGVSKDSNFEQIKQSYRKLAKEHHPDKGGDKERFQQIQVAYEVLSDSNKRQEYDMQQNFRAGGGPPSFMFGQGGMPPFFNFNFHNNMPMNNPNVNIRKKNEEFTLNLSLRDVYFGCMKTFNIMRKVQCDNCKVQCHNCKGTGVIVMNIQLGPIIQRVQQDCNLCYSKGFYRDQNKKCDLCKNSGIVKKEKFISLSIPQGVSNGRTYTYEGWGEQASNINEISGDFIIKVNVENDATFTRNNLDLIYSCKITLIESIIGKEIEIDVFDEKINININIFGIINPNKLFFIKDKGLKDENNNRGNLIIKFEIEYYDNKFLTKEQTQILSELFTELNLK